MEWIGTKKEHTLNPAFANCDLTVLITKQNTRERGYAVNFVFHNKSFKKIAPTLERIMVGINGSRAYFKEDKRGYKLTEFNKDRTRCRFKVEDERIKVTDTECGSYMLEFDEVERLYYIDVRNKLEKKINFVGAIKK